VPQNQPFGKRLNQKLLKKSAAKPNLLEKGWTKNFSIKVQQNI
jgi:hypothetical protein